MISFLATSTPGITQWLLMAAILYCIGLCGLLTRRNAVGILMSVELMLNAAAMMFVIFNHFRTPSSVDGHVMAIFIIAVAAAESRSGDGDLRGVIPVSRHDRCDENEFIEEMITPDFGAGLATTG